MNEQSSKDPTEAGKLLWSPSPERVQRACITQFSDLIQKHHGARISDFDSLWRWSVQNRGVFWREVWDFVGILASALPSENVLHADLFPSMGDTDRVEWFPGAKLNYAENLLRHSETLANDAAIIFQPEVGESRSLTWKSLAEKVSVLAQYLRGIGIRKGDRVAAYIPNIPEAVIGMLAASSIGVIWSSTSPDFGVKGVCDRLRQIEPRVLIVADGYYYNGKWHSSAARTAEIVKEIPSIESVLVVSYTGSATSELSAFGSCARSFFEIEAEFHPATIEFEQLPFNQPLFILYSSGTTGVPKCIVHGAGGTLLQLMKEHQLHVDLQTGDRVFYFTTCGWMMWNWLTAALSTGSTICLYDGSPLYPSPDRLFDFIDENQINVFGTSARYLMTLEKLGQTPRETHSLQSLTTILSTGSPLPPSTFRYLYSKLKTDVCLSSISGGTDIVSCFALGNSTLPVYEGEIQCCGLGMAVDIFDERGESTAGKGELVCTAPFPSMPVSFWNDPDGQKYHDSYFATYPNVWRHGDWAEITATNGIVIYGRSDAVLNPGGVRIGTAEIYRVVEQLDWISESAVIGQRWRNDERIVLFVKLKDNVELTQARLAELSQLIRSSLTPRHVPAKILSVPDLPRTLNGKLAELAIRNIVNGDNVKNREALANPDSLEYFTNLLELESE